MSALKHCPHLTLYLKQLSSFSCRTEYSGVLFIGTRTRDAEVKKAANQHNDDNWLGKRGKDILQSDAKVWKLGRAMCTLTASQDAAGNLTTHFLPDIQVKEDM